MEISMASLDEINRSLGRLEGTLTTFMKTQFEENQTFRDKLKDNKEFLQNEVAKALNSHAEIKNDLKVLKDRHIACPVWDLKTEVDGLTKITSETAFLHDNPDIKKGNDLWKIIKVVGMIIGGLVVVISLLNDVKDLFSR